MKTTTLRGTWSLAAYVLLSCLGAGAALAQSPALPNRHDPLENVTTAGQPSEADFKAAAAAGYKSVIDLRGPTEDRGLDEQKTVEKLGMNYVNLPVQGAGGVTYENANALDKLLADLPKPVFVTSRLITPIIPVRLAGISIRI